MCTEDSSCWQHAVRILIAGIILGALMLGGFAASARAQWMGPQAYRPAGLQKLVQELSDQFWYSYRANVPEHRLRHEQLRQAIIAWNASTQSAADRQTMVTWLRDAMQASMPGVNQPMPPVPDFGGAKPQAEPDEPTTVQPQTTTTSTLSAEEHYAPASPAPADVNTPAESVTKEPGEFQFSEPVEPTPAEKPAGSDPFMDDSLGF